ncbi:hypothetical protein [Actinosynnema sp. NPDC020468]
MTAQLLGALYLACVAGAVTVALLSTDPRRRADARKVLTQLLSIFTRRPP